MKRSYDTSSKQKALRGLLIFNMLALVYILLTGLVVSLTRNTKASARVENEEWIASGRYWIDRQLCRWIGCCGTFHMLNHRGWTWPNYGDDDKRDDRPFAPFWTSGPEDPTSWTDEERARREIPQYVFDHAPFVHLYSGEGYWPSDIAEHLVHTTPFVNFTAIRGTSDNRDLDNLDELNGFHDGENGRYVYLHSDENIEDRPGWLGSEYNKPVASQSVLFGDPPPRRPWTAHEDLRRRRRNDDNEERIDNAFVPNKSGAPAVLIVVPKEDGIVDAFWFFFYSYNLGKRVLGIRFGNHVGDWEHTMVRFRHGRPHQIFLSEHSFGQAYTWEAIGKYGRSSGGGMVDTWSNDVADDSATRPVVYSAEGSHAMYASPGFHPYIVPFGILHDTTDRGPLWDPALNVKSFTYDLASRKLRSSTLNSEAPTAWFDFNGQWGDKYYYLRDPRQYRFAGQYHYLNGPLGPKFKDLGRKEVCQGTGDCRIRTWLGG